MARGINRVYVITDGMLTLVARELRKPRPMQKLSYDGFDGTYEVTFTPADGHTLRDMIVDVIATQGNKWDRQLGVDLSHPSIVGLN